MITELTDATFDKAVGRRGDGLCLVVFSAPWCGPSRLLKPALEELSDEYRDRVRIFEVNTDEAVRVTSAHRISAIPTVVLYQNETKLQTSVGVQPKSYFKDMVDHVAASSVSGKAAA